MARAAFLVIGVGAMALSLGCSSTSGSTWVRQPEPGAFANEELTTSPHDLEPFDQPRTFHHVADNEGDLTARSRPRLDRTITLGEVHAVASEPAEAKEASAAPVSVTINNYVAAPTGYDGGYYGGYYGGYLAAPIIAGGARPGLPHPAPRTTQPGQDWPKPPSYGPAFPFKTAPASPWR